MKINSIDIFCQVIDNYGDVGVAYRLAREFKRVYPNKKLRFIINQMEELNLIKKSEEIEIITYQDISKIENSADLIIEFFYPIFLILQLKNQNFFHKKTLNLSNHISH